jgi:hypothetical protein
MMKEIFDFRYLMELRGGGDVWRPFGNTPTMGQRYLSTPVEFDEDNDILTTASGSVYKIQSYAVNREEVIAQIKKDIANGGCEVH